MGIGCYLVFYPLDYLNFLSHLPLWGKSIQFLIISVINSDTIKPLIHVVIITYYICKFFSVFYFEVFETHTEGEHTYNLHVDGAIADTIRMFQLSLLAGTPLPTNIVKKIYVKQGKQLKNRTDKCADKNHKSTMFSGSFVPSSIQLRKRLLFFPSSS